MLFVEQLRICLPSFVSQVNVRKGPLLRGYYRVVFLPHWLVNLFSVLSPHFCPGGTVSVLSSTDWFQFHHFPLEMLLRFMSGTLDTTGDVDIFEWSLEIIIFVREHSYIHQQAFG